MLLKPGDERDKWFHSLWNSDDRDKWFYSLWNIYIFSLRSLFEEKGAFSFMARPLNRRTGSLFRCLSLFFFFLFFFLSFSFFLSLSMSSSIINFHQSCTNLRRETYVLICMLSLETYWNLFSHILLIYFVVKSSY